MIGSPGKLAALTVATSLLFVSAAAAGWWDDVAEAEKVKLTDVIDAPREYLRSEVSFVCMFHEIVPRKNPYYTRFTPSQYVCFAAWPAERRIWRRGEYLKSHSFLFLSRDHKSLPVLQKLAKYSRLRLTGYVQNTFRNTPWIEVRHVEVLEDSFTQDTLRRIILGDQAAKEGDWEKALRHFTAATRAVLPAEVSATVEKKRAGALSELGRTGDARAAYARALEFMPGDEEALEALAALGETPEEEPVSEEQPNAESLPVEAVVETAAEEAPPSPAPARARPVDPSRYREPPAAMPPPAEPQPPAAAPAAEKAPEEPADEPAPEKPVRKKSPRKRMAGPM